MQNTDPFTASWLVALSLLLGALFALPILRAIAAIALHVFAAATHRDDIHVLAKRVMPRIGHLIGSVVLGITSTAAPAFAQENIDTSAQSITVDRDAAVPNVAPAPTQTADQDRSASDISVDRPTTAVTHESESAPKSDLIYVVRVGDSLWDIARSHMDHPTDEQTTAAWKTLWKANRTIIGDHPEHIEPGQVLHLEGLT